jgi:hypothetical protein
MFQSEICRFAVDFHELKLSQFKQDEQSSINLLKVELENFKLIALNKSERLSVTYKKIEQLEAEKNLQKELKEERQSELKELKDRYANEVQDFANKLESMQKENERLKVFDGFWRRLLMFVENVQVNDMMSEEEKGMIINICKAQNFINQ